MNRREFILAVIGTGVTTRLAAAEPMQSLPSSTWPQTTMESRFALVRDGSDGEPHLRPGPGREKVLRGAGSIQSRALQSPEIRCTFVNISGARIADITLERPATPDSFLAGGALATMNLRAMLDRIRWVRDSHFDGRDFDRLIFSGDSVATGHENELDALKRAINDSATNTADRSLFALYPDMLTDTDALLGLVSFDRGSTYDEAIGRYLSSCPPSSPRALNGNQTNWTILNGSTRAIRYDSTSDAYSTAARKSQMPSRGLIAFMNGERSDQPDHYDESLALVRRAESAGLSRVEAVGSVLRQRALVHPNATYHSDLPDSFPAGEQATPTVVRFPLANGVYGVSISSLGPSDNPRFARSTLKDLSHALAEGTSDRLQPAVFIVFTDALQAALAPAPADDESPLTLATFLSTQPNVLAVCDSSIRRNLIYRYDGSRPCSSYWVLGTASIMDWPNTARIIEVSQLTSTTFVIDTVLIETLGDCEWRRSVASDYVPAAILRELSSSIAWRRGMTTENWRDGNAKLVVFAGHLA